MAQEREEDLTPLVQESIDRINEATKSLYEEILASKDKFRELGDFKEGCLTKDESGFYSIQYQTEVPSAGGRSTPYAFALRVTGIKDKTFSGHEGYYTYPMPLLGLQYEGYFVKHPLRRQFDFMELVEKYGADLVDYQQKFMPLRFIILPHQEVYRIREPIHFTVVLANVSKHNILVDGLNKNSLFFTLNNRYWGATSVESEVVPATPYEKMMKKMEERIARIREKVANRRGGPSAPATARSLQQKVGNQVILRSEEALTLEFTGDSYSRPQDVEIRGTYQLNIKGLKPTAKIKIKIVKD